MSQDRFDLDDIQIAKPCDQSWDDMDGDERSRHCNACKLDVLNIAGMDREEATDLLESRFEEGACVRLFRRPDGTLLTQDCPVGTRTARTRRNRILAFGAATVAVLATVAAASLGTLGRRGGSSRVSVDQILDDVSHKYGVSSLCRCSNVVLGAMVGPLTPNAPGAGGPDDPWTNITPLKEDDSSP